MDQETQTKLKGQIIRYKDCPTADLRNSLFFSMQPFLERWTSSVLRRYKIAVTPHEFLSLVFHGFIFSLENYSKTDVPLPSHFYRYISYFLYSEFIKKHVNFVELNEEKLIYNTELRIEISLLYRSLSGTGRKVMEDLVRKETVNNSVPNYYQLKRRIKRMLAEVYMVRRKRK